MIHIIIIIIIIIIYCRIRGCSSSIIYSRNRGMSTLLAHFEPFLIAVFLNAYLRVKYARETDDRSARRLNSCQYVENMMNFIK